MVYWAHPLSLAQVPHSSMYHHPMHSACLSSLWSSLFSQRPPQHSQCWGAPQWELLGTQIYVWFPSPSWRHSVHPTWRLDWVLHLHHSGQHACSSHRPSPGLTGNLSSTLTSGLHSSRSQQVSSTLWPHQPHRQASRPLLMILISAILCQYFTVGGSLLIKTMSAIFINN